MKDLKEKAIRGGGAKLCAQFANFALRIISMAVLARLLDPKDFGLVAMVTAISGVCGMFVYCGLSTAAVQSKTISNEQTSALFWVNLSLGIVLTLIMLAIAPILVNYYHEPRLFWITATISLGFIVNAAGVQHFAKLERDMRFVTISVIEILSLIISIVISISMASSGFGYWALVSANLATPFVITSCSWLATRWIPGKPQWGVNIRPLLNVGGALTANAFISYFANNLEKVLLGRVWGANALGLYTRAYSIINIPNENLTYAIGTVLFSALSRLQSDPSRLKSFFLKGYSLFLTVTLIITVYFFLFANDIISVLLGAKWMGAVDIFRYMTPTVLVFGMIGPFGWLLNALRLLVRSIKLSIIIALLAVTSYMIGLPYGPKGVAIAYSVAMSLWLIPHIVWSIHGTIISFKDILKVIRKPYVAAFMTLLFTSITKYYFGELLNPFLRVIIGGLLLTGTYICILMFILGQKNFYIDLIKNLLGKDKTQTDLAAI